MAHVGEKPALGEIGGIGLHGQPAGVRQGLLKSLLSDAAIGDVACNPHCAPFSAQLDLGQGEFDGELAAILVDGGQFQELVEDLPLARPPQASQLLAGQQLVRRTR